MPSNRRSSSEPRRARSSALSVSAKTTRIPSIDMDTVEDVATLTCLEVSRAIMYRPEVDTGKLFSLIAAANSTVNKSDAVIVISAAILKSIGNSRGSEKLLGKSQTVTDYYKAMRLNDDSLRNSFVIMLFALAPEFVKMIESATSMALNRVKEMTAAPHSNTKMLIAANELIRDGTISPKEHSDMMRDYTAATIGFAKKDESSNDSITNTPTDGITFDDSISRVGKSEVVSNSNIYDEKELMSYAKRVNLDRHREFYKKYPRAKRPVELSSYKNKAGIGYKANESAIVDDISEGNFTSAINNIFNWSPVSKRPVISKAEGESLRKMPIRFRKSLESDSDIEILDARKTVAKKYSNVEVTLEDIKVKKDAEVIGNERGSVIITNEADMKELEELFSLL